MEFLRHHSSKKKAAKDHLENYFKANLFWMDWVGSLKFWQDRAISQTISEPVLFYNHNKPKNNNSSSQTAILFLAFND